VTSTRLALALLAFATAAGCSTRRYVTVLSDPPGAHAYVNGIDMGPTPAVVPFVHYGRFEVRLEKAGYESLAADVRVPTQRDGYPFVDLPQELTVPERWFQWTGRMVPIQAEPTETDARAVYDRSLAFRDRTYREVAEPCTPGRIPPGSEYPPGLHPPSLPAGPVFPSPTRVFGRPCWKR
jgi:hypothetical protein